VCFERCERPCLYFTVIPTIIVFAWTIVCMVLYPIVPYCAPPRSLNEDCKVMSEKIEIATLAASGVLVIISLVLSLFLLFVSGSWSLHSQKNKVTALSVLVVLASCAVQLVMAFLQRGVVVNYEHVDSEQEHFIFTNGTNISAVVNTSLYLSDTRLVLCVREIDEDVENPTDVYYDKFDMTAPITTGNITVFPDYPIDISKESLEWKVENLIDGHTYLFALIPATETGTNGTVLLHTQTREFINSPFETMLNETGCYGLRFISDIKYVDMRLFYACEWSNKDNTCNNLELLNCAFR